MLLFRCTSCQTEIRVEPPRMPPSQCPKCSGSVTLLRDTEPPPPAEPDLQIGHPSHLMGQRIADQRTLVSDGKQLPPVFMSTIIYRLSRELGPLDATAELHRQIGELREHPEVSAHGFHPVARLVARAMDVFEVNLLVDAGGSNIGKSRSRAAQQFLASDRDIWIMADEDVDASEATLAALAEAVGQGAPSVCMAPCLMRDLETFNVAFPEVVVDRALPLTGAKVRTAATGGLGLVAVSREALVRLLPLCPSFLDEDGETRRIFFRDELFGAEPPIWVGEDLSFFAMLPPSVRVESLVDGGTTVHDGGLLDCKQLGDCKPMPLHRVLWERYAQMRGLTEHRAAPAELAPQRLPELEPEQTTVVDGPASEELTPATSGAESEPDEQEQPEAAPQL